MKKDKILLTNIQLHPKATESGSFQRKLNQAIKTNKSGRFYGAGSVVGVDRENYRLKVNINIPKDLEKAINNGSVQISDILKQLSVVKGQDLDRFLESKHGKRIIRKLEKAGKI